MLVRVLTMRVVEERLDDWLRYTREIGLPGMRAIPGCKGAWRLHQADAGATYQVVTLWESPEALATFRTSQAMKDLSAKAVGLTIPPHQEALYDHVPD